MIIIDALLIQVRSFISWCGGLPAPENSDNPLRYKFSWSPLGVLKNVLSGARYLKNGRVVEIPDGDLLKHTKDMDFLPGFSLEGFPNRDSVQYAELYNIKGATEIVRGTLRFKVSFASPKVHVRYTLLSSEQLKWSGVRG